MVLHRVPTYMVSHAHVVIFLNIYSKINKKKTNKAR